ncbi:MULTISPECIES: helix-turn-helix transcriptional regulator [unclassified Streptomyces]|uniref:helix-turn-helix domain-containing protein n=1 Tax=unclassified Streptomyces TaxID=2593676 RepID=UPI00316ADA2A
MSCPPRQAEVAQLAASGLTNREIAATLHLSPRTVEQHIVRAMRKTGALSRRGLASRPGGGSSDSERPFVCQGQLSRHGEEELGS